MTKKTNEVEMTPDQKDTTKKIINFIIDILKLIVSAFLGASGANMFN